MGNWLNAIKDTALSATVRTFLAGKLEGYGKINQLKIDTKTHRIDLEVLLEGEAEPVMVAVENYSIVEENGGTFVSLPADAFTSSRLWLTKLLNNSVAGRPHRVPDQYAKYARSLVG